LERPDKNAVMTAWALGPADKANVIARFAFELSKFESGLKSVETETPHFLSSLEKFNAVAPEQAAMRVATEVEHSKQFAELLPSSLMKVNLEALNPADQSAFYASIKPYQDTAQQLAQFEELAKKKKQEEVEKIVAKEQLPQWTTDWKNQVDSKLAGVRQQAKPSLPKDWAASGEKQPTASEKPAADKAAIKSLRDSATRVEESRSNVRKINQVSQEWFTSPKSRKTKAPPKVNKKTGALAP
jgi:hypothetical protein